MSKSTNLSTSDFQLQLETEIFDAVSRYLEKPLINEPLPTDSTSFHFDFRNTEHSIIGEIYSGTFPLKSGHQRKINTDVLKMLAYEKSKGNSMKKYLVLTIDPNRLSNLPEVLNTVIDSEKDHFSMFGEKSWFSQALKNFDIHVLYYVLSKEQKLKLDHARLKQIEGMKLVK